MNNTTNSTSPISIRKILKILEALCIAFVFCPAFMVSCSGQTTTFSMLDMTQPIDSAYGHLKDSAPFLYLCLLIPIIALILLFSKKIPARLSSLLIMLGTCFDWFLWFIVKLSFANFAAENYCTFDTTAVYTYNAITMITIIGMSFAAIFRESSLDTSSERKAAPDNDTSSTIITPTDESENIAIKYCHSCGNSLSPTHRFCNICGTQTTAVNNN